MSGPHLDGFRLALIGFSQHASIPKLFGVNRGPTLFGLGPACTARRRRRGWSSISDGWRQLEWWSTPSSDLSSMPMDFARWSRFRMVADYRAVHSDVVQSTLPMPRSEELEVLRSGVTACYTFGPGSGLLADTTKSGRALALQDGHCWRFVHPNASRARCSERVHLLSRP